MFLPFRPAPAAASATATPGASSPGSASSPSASESNSWNILFVGAAATSATCWPVQSLSWIAAHGALVLPPSKTSTGSPAAKTASEPSSPLSSSFALRSCVSFSSFAFSLSVCTLYFFPLCYHLVSSFLLFSLYCFYLFLLSFFRWLGFRTIHNRCRALVIEVYSLLENTSANDGETI